MIETTDKRMQSHAGAADRPPSRLTVVSASSLGLTTATVSANPRTVLIVHPGLILAKPYKFNRHFSVGDTHDGSTFAAEGTSGWAQSLAPDLAIVPVPAGA